MGYLLKTKGSMVGIVDMLGSISERKDREKYSIRMDPVESENGILYTATVKGKTKPMMSLLRYLTEHDFFADLELLEMHKSSLASIPIDPWIDTWTWEIPQQQETTWTAANRLIPSGGGTSGQVLVNTGATYDAWAWEDPVE